MQTRRETRSELEHRAFRNPNSPKYHAITRKAASCPLAQFTPRFGGFFSAQSSTRVQKDSAYRSSALAAYARTSKYTTANRLGSQTNLISLPFLSRVTCPLYPSVRLQCSVA